MNQYSIRKKFDEKLINFLDLEDKKLRNIINSIKNKKALEVLNNSFFRIDYLNWKKNSRMNYFVLLIKKEKKYLIYYLKIFFLDLFFCFKYLIIGFYYFFKKKKLFKINGKFPIVLDYFYGLSDKLKNDFPFELDFFNKSNKLILVNNDKYFSDNKIQNSSIIFLKWNKKFKGYFFSKFYKNALSYENRKILLFLIKNWINNPLFFSLAIKFHLRSNFFYNIFKNCESKIYIDPSTGISGNSIYCAYAISKLGGKSFNIQRSFIATEQQSILNYACKNLIAWSPDIKKKISRFNNISNFIYYVPPYFQKKNKIREKKFKLISIFDSSFGRFAPMSVEEYNDALSLVLKKFYYTKDIKFLIKFKNTEGFSFLNKVNLKLIENLKKHNRIYFETNKFVSNYEIINKSDLCISFNSLTIFSESVFYETKNLSYINKGIESSIIKKINDIYPSCANNLDDFGYLINKKIFEIEPNFEKLKNLFFIKGEFELKNFLK